MKNNYWLDKNDNLKFAYLPDKDGIFEIIRLSYVKDYNELQLDYKVGIAILTRRLKSFKDIIILD